MSDLPPSLKQQINLAAGNLERARKYNTGLILFVIYQIETLRADFERLLLIRITQDGQRVRRLYFHPDDPPEASDLLRRLQQDPPKADEAIFVYNLGYAFPGLLNVLNYRRELIADNHWRLLFWAQAEEVVEIMRQAPDFWAFVNQTIELPEVASIIEQGQLTEDATRSDQRWANRLAHLSPDERQARIALRERLLAELPPDQTTYASQAELHYVLGNLYHVDAQLKAALNHYRCALELYRKLDDQQGQANTRKRLDDLATRLDEQS